MANVFSFNRFLKLLNNHLSENKRKYLLFSAAVFIIGLIIFFLILNANSRSYYYESSHENWGLVLSITFFTGLFILGGLFASNSFVNFNNKAEAIFYLNKPASQLEKWLVEIVIRVVFFFLVYSLIFYIICIPATAIFNSLSYQTYLNHIQTALPEEAVKIVYTPADAWFWDTLVNEKSKKFTIGLLFSIYITLVSFFMFGAATFHRFSFIKTMILAFLIGVGITLYFTFVFEGSSLMPQNWHFKFPERATMYENNNRFTVNVPEILNNIILIFLMWITPLVFFVSSLFKLKEKQI